MQFRDWMDAEGWTAEALAAELDCHPVNVRKYRAGTAPGRGVVERIAVFSGGAVMPNDWLSAESVAAIARAQQHKARRMSRMVSA